MAKPKATTTSKARAKRIIQTRKIFREGRIEARAAATDDQAVEDDRRRDFSFASEFPVRRYWGTEVLEISRKAMNLERLERGVLPLLVDHSSRDVVGVVESVRVGADKVVRGVARFGRSARASEVLADVDDGIRSGVSFGYIVDRMLLEEESAESGERFRVVEWTPLEVTLEAVPADPTVGMGRGADGDAEYVTRVDYPQHTRGQDTMDKINVLDRASGVVIEIAKEEFNEALHRRIVTPTPAPEPEPEPKPAAGAAARASASADVSLDEQRKAERKRCETIRDLGAKYRATDQVGQAIGEGWPVERFQAVIIEQRLESGEPLGTPQAALGLSEGEARRYSLYRAISAFVSKDWTGAGFERECNQEIEKRLGRSAQGFFVPSELLELKRVITTASGGTGLKGTEHRPESFIELLRARAMTIAMGARTLGGLVGDLSIPRQSGANATEWVTEGAGSGATTDAAYDAVTLSPKTIRARQDVTRRMLLQSSPDVEDLTWLDMATNLALGVDQAVINGSGAAGQPEGILNVTGVGLVVLGANGGPPTWASVVNLIREVMIDNADLGSLGYLTESKAWAKMMTTEKVSGYPAYILSEPGQSLVGNKIGVSNQVPSNLVKGSSGAVCSAMIYGNWADALIGEWGVLDILPDPYTSGDTGGLVVRAFQDVDVAVRHAESFAVIVDMLTT